MLFGDASQVAGGDQQPGRAGCGYSLAVPVSMSVLSSCALFRRDPAAVHAAAETHDTPLKELLSTAGLGLGTTRPGQGLRARRSRRCGGGRDPIAGRMARRPRRRGLTARPATI
jgi:hypothetical protein